ncbi:MAG: 50S ribosomal protein L20 [Gemmatales bacterium]|nr:MAG: 50S ribosomal protein L20 [Gemmatales bacterium]
MRVRGGVATSRRRKRLRKLVKGFRLRRRTNVRQAMSTLLRARAFAYRDRRTKKRNFRRLWITRINAACRMHGIRYSQFIHGLQLALVELDRRSLSEIAIRDPETFSKIVDLAKAQL